MNPTIKRVLIGLFVCVAFAALAWPKLPKGEESGAVASSMGQGGGPLVVRGYVVEPQQLRDRIFVSGSILANEEVDLRAEVSGKVMDIYFEEGRPVEAGALLVKINDSELQAQLRQAAYRVRLAEDREERQRALLEQGGISQEEYDATLNELNVLRAQVELINAQIDKTELRAPFSGVVGLRQVSVGSYITPSSPIARLQDVRPVKIEFAIPERYANRVQVGDEVFFTVEGVDDRFRGEIYAFEPRIEAGTRTLTVRALSPNDSGRLVAGAFTNVELVFEELDDAVAIPTIAVIPELGGKKVFVVQDGQATPRPVETGIRMDDRIQVVSGLSPQDTVITTGLQQVRPGAPVVVQVQAETPGEPAG